MGIVFRQSIKTAIVSFTGALLGVIVTYLFTELFSLQEFGFAKNLLTQAVVGSQLVLMGIHTTLYIYITKYPPEHPGRSVLITLSLLTPVVITSICTLAYALFEDSIIGMYQIQDIVYITRYFYWLPLYVLLWAMMTLLEHFLAAHMKVAASTFLREVILKGINIILILAYGFDFTSFDAFIVLSVLVHIIPVSILWLMSRRIDGFSFSINWKALSRKEYKSIFDFAIFHLLLNVSISLLHYLDILMIPVLDTTGMDAVAIYAVAVLVMSVFEIPYRALASAATPILNKTYVNNTIDDVREMFRRSGLNLWIVTFGMAALIIANLHNLVDILNPKYSPIYAVVIILMLGRTVNMLTGLNNELLSISQFYRFNFYITAGLIILMVLTNYYMIPKYGIIGAAWATTLSVSLYNIIKLLFLWIKMNIHPFAKGSATILIIGIVAGCTGFFMPYVYNTFVDVIIRSIVIGVVYVGMLVWLKPSEDIITYLNSIRENKRLF